MATANLLQTSVSGGTQNALSLQGDGVFFPKASTASRLALTLTTTDKGFIVYDTTDNNIYFWNGTAWESIPGSGDAGANGSVQYNDNGIVSGASNFTYNKATSAVSIAGALTVDTTTLVVDATNDQVGIGTATPVYKLHAVVTSGAVAKFGASTAAIARLLVGNTVGDLEVKINANADGQITSDAGKYLGLGSNSANDRVILTTTGNLSITNGNVVMATSGTGIDFSATAGTGTSEILADYEEGTWTGTVTGGTFTNLTTGRYTKIGRQVFASITPNTTAITGNLVISGLPFAAGARSAMLAATLPPTGVTYIPKFVDPTDVYVDVSGVYAAGSVSTYFAFVYNV